MDACFFPNRVGVPHYLVEPARVSAPFSAPCPPGTCAFRPRQYRRRCVGAVVVTVIDQHHQQPSSDVNLSHRAGNSSNGGNGGNAAGGGNGGGTVGGHKLFVPIVLEALPDSCLGVARKVDLGPVALDSSTSSSFEVKNLSAGPAPLRCERLAISHRDKRLVGCGCGCGCGCD